MKRKSSAVSTPIETVNPPVSQEVFSNSSNIIIVKGAVTGLVYRFNGSASAVQVMKEDIPDLLKMTRTYTPCCSGKKTTEQLFRLFKEE